MKRIAPYALSALALILAAVVVWHFRPARRPAPGPEGPPAQTAKKTTLTLYFANRSYVETGDESLPHLLPEDRLVELDGRSRAEAAVRALQAGPKSPKAGRVIGENVRIKGVRVESDLAYVDLDRAGLYGGSLDEVLMVASVVKTLTDLPGIRAVQFLVDGERVDSLMGHLSVGEPLTAADLH